MENKTDRITNIKHKILEFKNKVISTSALDCSCENDFIDKIAQYLKSGADIIIFNNPISSKKMLSLGFKLRQLCSIYDALLIVYDRLDIVQIIDADGLLLDNYSLDFNNARKLLHHDKFIALETDDISDISEGFDFIISNKMQKTKLPLFIKKNFYISEKIHDNTK